MGAGISRPAHPGPHRTRRAPNFGQEAGFPLWASCPFESDSLARLSSFLFFFFSFFHHIPRQGKLLPVKFITDVLTKSWVPRSGCCYLQLGR